MTFPSDYKRVQQPGGTSGVVNAENGLARQLIIDTSNWNIRLMDGATPGGYQIMMVHDLAAYLQMNQFLPQGTQAQVENDTGSPSAWAPQILLDIFQKLANTATAGSWFIKSAAMPISMRDAAAQTLDANSITVNGFYVADPSVCLNLPAAIPTSNSLNVAIQVICQSIDNICQVAYIRDGSARIWVRTKTDTVWGAWVLASGVTAADLALKLNLAGGTMSGDLDLGANDIRGVLTLNDSPIRHANAIINGNFDVWQRSVTAQTSNGYGSDDRWFNGHVGSTKSHTRGAFGVGSTAVNGSPKYFSQTVVTSVAGASNCCYKEQRIEGVSTLQGKNVTLTWWGNTTTANKDIAVELSQVFGTGGSPSATVTGIGVQRKTLLTSGWTKFSVVIAIPSISGKTLGSNNDDYLALRVWFDAGSSFNARTANLGQQSGTFNICHFSITEGDLTKEFDPYPTESLAETLFKCQRFFEAGTLLDSRYGAAAGTVDANQGFKVPKRAVPAITNTGSVANYSGLTAVPIGINSLNYNATYVATGQGTINNNWTADAEL